MTEEKPPKGDKAFTSILLLALNCIEVVSYVGVVTVWIVAAWAIWKFGWKEFHQIFWPALGIFTLLAGSILGVKFLRRMVV